MACDVLNLEWSSSGRDREVGHRSSATPFAGAGHHVVEESIFNYRYLAAQASAAPAVRGRSGGRADQPRGLASSPTELGIPTVWVDAEGNYVRGWPSGCSGATSRTAGCRQRLKLQWSVRSRDAGAGDRAGLARSAEGDRRGRVRPLPAPSISRRRRSGGESTGSNRSERVGYAGWAFDYCPFGRRSVQSVCAFTAGQAVERFRRDRDALRELLPKLIRGRTRDHCSC